MWGWVAWPKPAGLALLPSIHRLCVDGSDHLQEVGKSGSFHRYQNLRPAWPRGLLALCFTDVANQLSTLPLSWVTSPFDDLGIDLWVFCLILMPSGSTD